MSGSEENPKYKIAMIYKNQGGRLASKAQSASILDHLTTDQFKKTKRKINCDLWKRKCHDGKYGIL